MDMGAGEIRVADLGWHGREGGSRWRHTTHIHMQYHKGQVG